jgi:hypothetical protein
MRNATVARTLTGTIPDAKLELVANNGHVLWLGAPHQAAKHVGMLVAAQPFEPLYIEVSIV